MLATSRLPLRAKTSIERWIPSSRFPSTTGLPLPLARQPCAHPRNRRQLIDKA
jgi:hypothetical protein